MIQKGLKDEVIGSLVLAFPVDRIIGKSTSLQCNACERVLGVNR